MKRLYSLLIAISLIANMYGQAPAGFNYQAVARNASGQLITNTQVTIQIEILKGSIGGTSVYTESFSPTTNNFGLVNLNVGNGTVLAGSFSDIDWGADTYFIKVWLNSTEMGTTQLLSVPYALHAKTAENLTGGITETDPEFTAWDKSTGITIPESQITDLQSYLLTELDPVYRASLASHLTEVDTAYWNKKLSSFTELDPLYSAWDKSTGIAINESQIRDLQHFTNADETDPIFSSSVAIGIKASDTTYWSNKLGSYTETDPIFSAWNKSAGILITENQISDLKSYLVNESDPLFTNWDKTTGITIPASQVSDFQTSVANNPAVLANTAKYTYPQVDSIKLAGIQAGAEVNVNADWNATSGNAQILNQPVLATVATSGNYNDLNNKPIVLNGTNIGDLQYWNGTSWVVIPVGQPGQFMRLNTSNIPTWSGAAYPTLINFQVTSMPTTTATFSGNVAADGGANITARGICYNTTGDPNISDNVTIDGTGTGLFFSSISGLIPNTLYYVRSYTTNNIGTTYSGTISFIATLAVGDSYQGGKVAYIFIPGDPGYIDGQIHGLITPPGDQGSQIDWWNGSFISTGATGTSLGTGNSNTNSIVTIQGNGNYAAKICYDLELDGYTDWYLPSVDELKKLYMNQAMIGGFASVAPYYWSSTEASDFQSFFISFSEGIQVDTNKTGQIYVRAVRSF